MNIQIAGRKKLDEYINTGKLSKLNLHIVDEQLRSKSPQRQKHVQKQLNTEMEVLKRTLLDNTSHTVEEMLKHELLTYPPSIAEVNLQTQHIVLRTGNKSSLMDNLRTRSGLDKWPVDIPPTSEKTSIIFDAMGSLELKVHYRASRFKHLLNGYLRLS